METAFADCAEHIYIIAQQRRKVKTEAGYFARLSALYCIVFQRRRQGKTDFSRSAETMTQTNSIFPSERKSGHGQSQVPSGSFYEVLQAVRDQININCFFREDWNQVSEIFLIIAEMYKLPPQAEVQISGQKLPASLVQEVYLLLKEEHISRVMQNYEEATYPIKFKKTYIRTALYNVVFEYESGDVNGFRTAFPEFPKRRHE